MMDSSLVIELVFQALRMALVLSGPILLAGLVMLTLFPDYLRELILRIPSITL